MSYAATSNNSQFLEKLLAEGALINAQDSLGCTALHRSVATGICEMVRKLVEKNADVNIETRDGWTALDIAVKLRNEEIVRILAESGRIEEGKSYRRALVYAASTDSVEIVRYLSEYAPSAINYADERERTPLMIATADYQYAYIAKVLSNSQVDSSSVDGSERSAFDRALESRNTRIISLFLQHNPDGIKYTRKSLLDIMRTAAELDHIQLAKVLLAEATPEDLRKQDSNGCTAFMRACAYGRLEMVKLLYDAALPQVNTVNKDGQSALLLAVKGGNCDLLGYLLTKGYNAEVNTQDKWGETCVHHAAVLGHTDKLRLLFDAGADLKKSSNRNVDPFMVAANCGHTELLRELYKLPRKGALLSWLLKAVSLVTGPSLFCEQDSRRGWNSVLCSIVGGDFVETLELLWKEDAGLFDHRGFTGRNVWHFAVLYRRNRILEFLIRHRVPGWNNASMLLPNKSNC